MSTAARTTLDFIGKSICHSCLDGPRAMCHRTDVIFHQRAFPKPGPEGVRRGAPEPTRQDHQTAALRLVDPFAGIGSPR